MFKDWKIGTRIFAASVLSLLMLTGALIAYSTISTVRQTRREVSDYRASKVEEIRANLRNYVDVAHQTIIAEYEKSRNQKYLEDRFGMRLKTVVDLADAAIASYVMDARANPGNTVALQAAAKRQVEAMRYDGGTGYLWINDTTKPVPRMVMHPTLPDLNGRILDASTFDSVGEEKKNLFVAFNEICEQDGHGFVQYMWPKPTKDGLTEYQPKLSYVRLIPEWNWIIGTGIYIDDAVREAKSSAMSIVKEMRYDAGVGYFWINDTTQPIPRMVMHPTLPALDGQILDDPKFNSVGKEKKNLFAAFREATEDDEEGFVSYTWPKPTKDGLSEYQPKESYVRRFGPWNWIVGTGVYVDDIDRVVEAKQAAMSQALRRSMLTFLAIAILLAALSTIPLLMIVRSLVRPIHDVVVWSGNLADGDLTQRLELNDGSELGLQARNLNQAADSIAQVIIQLQAVTEDADSVKEDLSTSTEDTAAAVAQIAANLGSNRNQLENLEEATQEATTAASHISANVRSLHELIDNQVAAVSQSSSAVEQMMSSISSVASTSEIRREAAQQLNQMVASGREKVVTAADTAERLAHSISSMKEITSMITQISSQSNLLSMNAAIEAAHAGDHGRGFAVVAEEMRSLSENTAVNAKAIQDTLGSGVTELEGLVTATQETANVFNEIEAEVVMVSQSLTEITHTMEEMSHGSKEIVSAVEDLRQISAAVQSGARDMSEGSDVVTKSIEGLSHVFAEASGAAAEIGIGAEEIQTSMSALTARVGSVVEKIGEIRDGIKHFQT